MNKYLLTPDMEFMYTEVRILSKFSLVNQIVLLGLLTRAEIIQTVTSPKAHPNIDDSDKR